MDWEYVRFMRDQWKAPLLVKGTLHPADAEMALRIEKAFGISMDTLMRMQNSFDIAQTRKREGEIKVARFKSKADGASRPAI